jgi:hypothetical protein
VKWNRAFQRAGYVTEESGTAFDPFSHLSITARADGRGTAKVSFTVGSSREYGEIKCSATVTIECPQDEKHINMAGECAYRKALELTNDAASQLEIPQLPAFVEPKE